MSPWRVCLSNLRRWWRADTLPDSFWLQQFRARQAAIRQVDRWLGPDAVVAAREWGMRGES